MAARKTDKEAQRVAFEAETTVKLLERAKAGEAKALDTLLARYLPAFQRWAKGRLPRWARDLLNTDDLVQETLLGTFSRIDGFELRRDGALQAYIRKSLLNRIHNEIRRVRGKPRGEDLFSEGIDPSPSPLEEVFGNEAFELYERGLQSLRPEEREAVIARIELGFTYQQVAEILGKPSADAARMAVTRALVRLAQEME